VGRIDGDEMTRTAFALCVFALSTIDAAAVTFSTTASQMCFGTSGCGVNGQTIGGSVRVDFVPVSDVTVAGTPPSNVAFGQVVVSCIGGGTACGSQSLAGVNLFIVVSQTMPTAGFGSITVGVITGTVSGNASNATITWATPNGVKVGTVNYSIVSNPVALVPPATASGTVTIVGLVADVTPPVLQGAKSRKAHGASTLDLKLSP
jgi:hypothetical protein